MISFYKLSVILNQTKQPHFKVFKFWFLAKRLGVRMFPAKNEETFFAAHFLSDRNYTIKLNLHSL